MSKYTGTEGEAVELAQAAEWTANYRKQIAGDANAARAHFFGREILQKILEQEGCVGIRMYHALNDQREQQLVLVGITAEGEDMEDGVVADRSRACPPDCSVTGLLGG
jgi:hypothetical protein